MTVIKSLFAAVLLSTAAAASFAQGSAPAKGVVVNAQHAHRVAAHEGVAGAKHHHRHHRHHHHANKGVRG